MKKFLISCTALFMAAFAQGQTPLSLTTTSYTQNFNGLDTIAGNSNLVGNNLLTGWAIFEVGTNTNNVNGLYRGTNGNTNTGDTYSAGTTGSTERALGSIASGTNRMRYGVGFSNNTGSTITGFTLNVNCEQWRLGDTSAAASLVADTTIFEYSTVATGISDTVSSWIASPSLMLNSPILAGTVSGGLDGNLAANKLTKTGSVSVTIPAGATIYLRWSDINILGGDDILALDDLSITFSTTANPKPLIVSTIPADNATGIAAGVTNLSITFDKPVTIGTGTLTVTENPGGLVQTFNNTQVTASGSTATINGVNIQLSKTYVVNFDSTLVVSGSSNSNGIYNTTDWNFAAQSGTPLITTLSPADNSVNVGLALALSVTFDKPITQGVGTIVLRNLTDGTQQTITTPSPVVTIAGNTASVSSISLMAGKKYCVLYDSSCFKYLTNNSLGITDTNFWNFTTEPPALNGISGLNETFVTDCGFPVMGNFVSYSVNGSQTWRCTTFGNGDAAAASMNGFSGSSQANEDWLISAPITFGAPGATGLNFFAKRRFNNGAPIREVLVSNNYTGTGDPNAATWTPLVTVPSLVNLDTVWTNFTANIPNALSAAYVAFKYTSGTTANPADEWSVDDVKVNNTTSIGNIDKSNTQVWINTAVNSDVLYIKAQAAQDFTVTLMNLNGKVIYNTSVSVNAGTQTVSLPSINLSNGLYLVRIASNNGSTTLKYVK
jgi:trimeric autotransporter adhesin